MEALAKMKEIDVRTIERESLIDIKKLKEEKISAEWAADECTARFIERVKNPYCFRVGKVVVKTVFTEGVSLNQRFEELIETYK